MSWPQLPAPGEMRGRVGEILQNPDVCSLASGSSKGKQIALDASLPAGWDW